MKINCKKHGISKGFKPSNRAIRCSNCASDAVKKRRKIIKEKAVEYKGGKCNYCGYNKCINALVFHHLNPSIKEFGLSANGITRSWNKTKTEIDKCILLCHNCHAEVHAK